MWGGTLDGSDVSAPQTQRTLTDTSTAQLQVPSPPSGSVRSSLSFPVTVPVEYNETVARTSSNGWFDSAEYAGYCTTATTSSTHTHSDVSSFSILPRKKSDVAPDDSRTITHTQTVSEPTAYAFGVTPTPQPQPKSTGTAPHTLNLPRSISKPHYNVVIASSSVSMTPSIPSTSFCPTLWTTSLTFHPTQLTPKQVTKTDWRDLEPLKRLAALKSDWMDCILLECGH